jgi:hypothetical protein
MTGKQKKDGSSTKLGKERDWQTMKVLASIL